MPKRGRGRGDTRGGRGRGGLNKAPSRAPPAVNLFDTLREEESLSSTAHSLASGPSVRSDQEQNTHLRERFGNTSRFADHTESTSSNPRNWIPISAPVNLNNHVREYIELGKRPVPDADAWVELPEIPSASEIMEVPSNFSAKFGDGFGPTEEKLINVDGLLRPKKVVGAYESKQDYLRTEYELLREDAIRPLREAVHEVRSDPWKEEGEYQNQSIGIYEPVYIKSLVFSPRGIATRVAFSLSRVKKHIRWDQSKRLITGSLVALTPMDDAFETTCIMATVAARPISALAQNPPEIDLFFPGAEQQIDPMKKWLMIECRACFYEASKHTMVALQHMMREPFPLSDYLVNVQQEVKTPAYVQKVPYMDLRSLVSVEDSPDFKNIHVLENWPSTSLHSLDDSQSTALKNMITHELSLVQGPPGTGKTFVSVKMLQVLLDNMKAGDPPLIVTAQTNHAVDQLLRHVQAFEPNYIRLGGRSKDEEVKKRTLFEVRSALPPQKVPGSQRVQSQIAMKKLTSKCLTILQPLEACGSPLDHVVLYELGVITQAQAESLEGESEPMMGMSANNTPGMAIEQWLGPYIGTCQRPVLPDDFEGMAWEEEEFEAEQLQELEAEAVAKDDDDIEALRGEVVNLSDNFKGLGSAVPFSEIEQILNETSDLTTIPRTNRGAIYNYFLRKAKTIILTRLRKLGEEYDKAALQRQVGRWEEDVRILQDARIIGMTTTGLSKYRALIHALQPRMILVEEAAETLEAPVTVACVPSLEHLVLVGDHQQLRPHTQVREFEDEPYYLNLSLFERLVYNDVAFDTLTRQRRMIPEIRRLLHPIYDNTLKDHSSVEDPENRPPVRGMGGTDSFFFSHTWPEDRDGYMSCVNPAEAKFIAGFFEYLVLNGEDPYSITVLTFYNGQRKRILSEIRSRDDLRGFPGLQVVTVDSYQGEENDIVLLSLVRSNRRGNIGFLDSENRACVALSRAKRGFYLFGNAELLARETRVWAAVAKIMWGKGNKRIKTGQSWRLGFYFPLSCSKHGNKSWIEVAEDWDSIKGGCLDPCKGKLPCGHLCPYNCHPFDHVDMNCRQDCSRRVEPCGHPCSSTCGTPCKCNICEKRSGGKSVLKVRVNKPGSVSAQGGQQNLLLDHFAQSPSNPISPDTISKGTEAWHTFVNGGARADDERYHKERSEQMSKGGREGLFVESHEHRLPGSSSSSGQPKSLLAELGLEEPDQPMERTDPKNSQSLLQDIGLEQFRSTSKKDKDKAFIPNLLD